MSGSNRGAALGSFLAVVVSIVVFVFVLEAGLRLLPIPLASPVVTINEPHDALGWTKRADTSTSKSTSEFDVTFDINALGLRDDDDLTRDKPDDTRRLLVVGDSFVLGYTVSRDDLFVDRLERAFAADGASLQVLNGGTEGYATDQELVWLREEGMRFEPDAVVLCFYQNDVYWCSQGDYAGTPKPRVGTDGSIQPPAGDPPPAASWLARNTALGGLAHRMGQDASGLVAKLSGGAWMPREEMVVLREERCATLSPEVHRSLQDAWPRVGAALAQMKATCEAAGVPLLVAGIPSREQIQPSSAETYLERYGLAADDVDFDLPLRRLGELSQAAGVAMLDPTSALKNAAADGETLYFEDDWHLNPAGNAVFAQSLYDRIVDDGHLRTAVGATRATEAGRAALQSAASSSWPRWPFVVFGLWVLLSVLFWKSYADEALLPSALKVGALLTAVVLIIYAVGLLADLAGPRAGPYLAIGVVVALLVFVLWKSRANLGIIREVYVSFVRQGLWYMIPLLVVMLAIGSLLIVASSSPFVAPFIYTLF